MFGRSLNDSGLAATPRCQPIVVQHPSDVTRRHDNSSPSSTSSSSHESGIKSTTDSSSPEIQRHQFHHQDHHHHHHHWIQQQQEGAHASTAPTLNIPDDVPLDLSVTSSLPRQRVNNDKTTNVIHRRTATLHHHDNDAVTSRGHDNDSQLSTPSVVNKMPLLSSALCTVMPRDVTHRHSNGNPWSALPIIDINSPLLSSSPWLLQQPPAFPQSLPYMTVPTLPPAQDTSTDSSMRLPEPAKLLLTSWYETHVRHPYPQPGELSELVMSTGQSRRKILKWLANRRARTGNTLPHNGSVHPKKIVKIQQLRQIAAVSGPHQRHQTSRSRQRSSRFLPDSVVDGLQRWYNDRLGYPYPTDAEKRHLAEQLGTTVVKVTNWFANKRNRSTHVGKSGNIRLQSDTALRTNPSTLPLDWQYSLTRFPQSTTSTLAGLQTRRWNDQGHLS